MTSRYSWRHDTHGVMTSWYSWRHDVMILMASWRHDTHGIMTSSYYWHHDVMILMASWRHDTHGIMTSWYSWRHDVMILMASWRHDTHGVGVTLVLPVLLLSVILDVVSRSRLTGLWGYSNWRMKWRVSDTTWRTETRLDWHWDWDMSSKHVCR